MANGIGNNERKIVPSGKNEKSNVCLSSFAETPNKGITGFKGISIHEKLKEQIRNGEYKAIKLSDKPLEVGKQVADKDDDLVQ